MRRAPAIYAPIPSLPSQAIVAQASRLLGKRYGIPTKELPDLVGQAILDFLAAKNAYPNTDGLFLIIAQRRACDFWRRYRPMLPLEAASALSSEPEEGRLPAQEFLRLSVQFALRETKLSPMRIARIVGGILAGLSFEEACRSAQIPRGSRGRYRAALQICFAGLRPGAKHYARAAFMRRGGS